MNLLNQFKEYLFSQDDAPAQVTVKNYISDVNHFIKWFENYTKLPFAPNQITDKDITTYQEQNKTELSAVSIQRHLSSLRKFFQFLKLEGIIASNPMEIENWKLKIELDPWKLKDFKNHLYENNSAHLTIKNYIIDIKQFITWAKEVTGIEEDLLVNRIDKDFIEEYKLRLLEKSGYSPATINRKLSSLRSYASWAHEQGLLTQNIISVENISKAKQKLHIPSPDELKIRNSKLEIPNKSYSRFPPLRLFQKIIRASTLAFDSMLIAPLAGATLKLQNFSWKLKGQPIFTKGPQSLITKNITHEDLLGIKNISKKFYAPFGISTKSFSPLQKLIFHARFTRPKWYKTYHSYAIAHYFNFAILVIFLAALGFGLFNAFFVKPSNQNPVLAALPTAPPRVLSFQGRLTDNNDNPITANTNVRYAIYNDITASGAALLWQEVNPVTPDTDGIFNSILGNVSSIPSTLFSENSALYLGVTIEATPELTPRQQLATVAYATNSETLQGLPPSTAAGAATSNVVLALDSSGNLSIGGSANPVFSATGGTFKLSGQPLLLTTNVGSNSNVNITTDGLGRIDLQKPIQNTSNSNNLTTALGSVEVDDLFSILATSSGQSALTINQNSTGPLISASTSGTAKFTVDNSGNETLAGNSTIAGTTGVTFSSTGGINLAGGTLSDSTDGVDVADALEVSGLITANGGLTVANGQTTTFANFNANNNVLYATVSTGVLAGANTNTTGQCLLSGASAPSWGACSAGGADTADVWWNQTSGALYPNNSTVDFLIGDQATTSALFSFTGVSNLSNQTQASISGQLVVVPNNGYGGNITTVNNLPLTISPNGTGALNLATTNTGAVSIGNATGTFTLNSSTIDITAGAVSGVTTLTSSGSTTIGTGASTNTVGAGASSVNTIGSTTTPGALTLHGATTLDNTFTVSGANLTSLGGNLTVTGTAWTATPTISGLITATSGLTANGTLDANAVVTLGDNGDNITIDSNVWDVTAAGVASGLTGLTSSGTITFSGFTSNGGVLYTNGSGVLAQATAGTASQCLLGGTTPAFGSCNSAGTDVFWGQTSGALYPNNSTVDLLVGGQATTSAKFAVLNVNSGTPVASVSSGLSGTSAYLTADGTLATQNRMSLTLGNSATYNTTGNVLINSNGTGNVGIGTAAPLGKLDVNGSLLVGNTTDGVLLRQVAGEGEILGLDTDNNEFNHLDIRTTTGTQLYLNTSGNVGIGTTNPGARLQVTTAAEGEPPALGSGATGSSFILASSNNLYGLYVGDRTNGDTWLQSTRNDGTATAYNILLNPSGGNVGIGTTTPTTNLDITGSASLSANLGFRGAATAHTFNILDNGTLNIQRSPGGDAGLATALFIQNNGRVGIGTTTTDYKLSVSGDIYASSSLILGAHAIVSGNIYASNGSLGGPSIAFNGDQDNGLYYIGTNNWGIVAGATKIIDVATTGIDVTGTLRNSSTVTFSTFTSNGGPLYTNGSGVLAQATAGTASQCLLGGTTPAFGSCATGATDTTDTFWNQTLGALYPNNSTVDLLIGGQATTSAEFAFTGLGLANHQTQASISGQLIVMPNNGYSGNVGIGTTSPTAGYKLDIVGDMIFSRAGTSVISAPTSLAIRIDSDNNSSSEALAIQNNLGAELMRINEAGNVGIGTTAPDARLEINHATGDSLRLTYNDSDGSATNYTDFSLSSSGDLTIVPSGGDANLTGNLAITGTSYDAHAVPAALDINGSMIRLGDSISSQTQTNGLGIKFTDVGVAHASFKYDSTNKKFFLCDSSDNGNSLACDTGQETLTVTVPSAGLGSVGINDTSPDAFLEVLGTTEQLRLTYTDGTVDSRFTVDSSGNLTIDNTGTITTIADDLAITGGNITSAVTADSTLTATGTLTANGTLDANAVVTLGDNGDNITIDSNVWDVTAAGVASGLTGLSSSGTITFSGLNGQNAVLYGTQTTGVVAQATTASANQCLLSGASAPAWGTCVTGAQTTDAFWGQTLGALHPNNSTVDFLIGGQSTASAKFAFTGLSNLTNQTQASFSGQLIVMPNNGYSGKVGIGTTTPGYALDVTGTGRFSTGIIASGYASAGNSFSSSGSDIYIETGATSKNIYLRPNGTGSNTGLYTFATTGLTSSGTGNSSFAGNVGIGDTTPDSFLEVLGTTEQLRLTYTDGTVDSRFTVDSSGNLTIDNTGTVTTIADDLAITGGNITSAVTADSTLTVTGTLTANGTLDANAVVTLGDNGDNITIDSNVWDVTAAGVASGLTGLTSSGTITFSGFTSNGGVLYTNGSGVLAQVTAGTASQCLLGGTTPSFGSCATGAASSDLYWKQTSGALYPNNSTVDFLIGSQATTSALFAFTGVAKENHQSQASISGQLIVMPNNGYSGKVGIGTTSPQGTLHVASTNNGANDDLILNQAATTNLVTNPSFEPNTTGWTLGGFSSRITTDSKFGSASIKWDPSGVPSTQNALLNSSTLKAGLAGETYTISVWLKKGADFTSGSVHLRFNHASAPDSIITPSQLSTTEFRRFTNTWTLAADANIGAQLTPDGANGVILADGWQLENGSSSTAYADGSLGPGYYWNGTPNASTSTRTAGAAFAYQTINSAGGLGASSRSNFPTLQIDQNGTGDIFVASQAGTNKFVITNSGNVGIGTTAPGSLLSVVGNQELLTLSHTISATTYTTRIFEDSNLHINRSAGGGSLYLGDGVQNWDSVIIEGNLAIFPTAIDGGSISYIRLGAGSVSAPVYSFYNDNNTGVYNPTGDNLGLVTGGTERIRIDGSGNVGIGTTAPFDKLDVTAAGSGGVGGRIVITNSAGDAVSNEADLGFKTSSSYTAGYYSSRIASLLPNWPTNNYGDLAFYNFNGGSASGTELMRIISTGKVGIGDSSPDAFLEVLGTTEQLRLTYTDGTVDSRFTVNSSGDLTVDSSGGQVYLADTDVINIGGLTAVAYNALANSTDAPEDAAIAADNDLYIGGDLEVDGTIVGNVTGNITGTATDLACTGCVDATDMAANSVDDSELVDTLNYSGNLTLSGTTFDVNSTAVSIADTDISFDGASTTFTTTGDLTLSVGGGNIISSSPLNIGGGAAAAYNYFGDAAGTPTVAASDDDLFIEDDLEVGDTASISGTLTMGGAIRPSTGNLSLHYKSAPNTWAAAMTIDTVGNVGIGTTTPTQKLDVTGTTKTNSLLANVSADNYAHIVGSLATGENGIVGDNVYIGKINKNLFKTDSEIPTITNCGSGPGIGVCAYAGTWSENVTTSTTLPTGLTGFSYSVNHSVAGGDFRPINYFESGVDLAGRTFTVSMWVKADSGADAAATWTSAYPGDSNSQTEASPTLTTSWQRVSFTRTLPAGSAGAQFTTYLTIPVHATARVHVWGMQIEESPVLTSYEKTTGTSWSGGGSGFGLWASDFRLGGTPAVPNSFWDNTNNRLGIGTTSPTALLDVAGTASVSGALKIYGTTPTIQSVVNKSLVIGGDTTGDIQFKPGNSSTSLYLQTGGNVGIGTTSPGVKLDVTGAITASTDITATTGKFATAASGQTVGLQLDSYVDAGSFNNYILNNSPNAGTYATLNFGRLTGTLFGFIRSNNNTEAIEIGTAATTRLTVSSGGNVGIGNTTPLTALDVTGSASLSANLSLRGAATAHTLNILDNGTLNIQRSPGGDAGLATALFIQNNGNVGIGTTSPGANLTVANSSGPTFWLTTNNANGSNASPLNLDIGFKGYNGYDKALIRATDQAANVSGSALAFYTTTNGSTTVSEKMRIDNAGLLGIGTTTPISSLHVTRPLSFGANGKALAIFDQIENQDIFTASASGATKFRVANDGDIHASRFVDLDNASETYYLDLANTGTSLVIAGTTITASALTTLTTSATLGMASTTTLNCADCIDFDDLKDSLTVDAATDINLGANALTIDLDSTGDFSVRDVTTDIATFADTGAITLAPTSGQSLSVNLGGAGDFIVNTNDLYVDTSVGFVSMGRTTTRNSANLTIEETAANKMNLILNNFSTTTNDYVGLGLRVSDDTNPDDTIKGAIFFRRTSAGNGRGDLFLATNNTASSINVAVADAGIIIRAAGTVEMPSLTTTTSQMTRDICQSGDDIVARTGTTNCAAASSLRYKQDIKPLGSASGLAEVMAFNPVSFRYTTQFLGAYANDPNSNGEKVGFIAEEMANIDSRLVNFDEEGLPSSIGYEYITSILSKAIQEQQLEIVDSQTKIASLEVDLSISDAGNLNVIEQNPDEFAVTDNTGKTYSRISALSEAVIATVTAGAIDVQNLSSQTLSAITATIGNLTTNTLVVATDQVTIAGQSLRDYIASIVNDVLQTTNYQLLTTNSIISPIASIDTLNTNVISPLAQNPDSKIAVKLNDASGNSKLEIRNSSNSAVATFDSAGNATLSGNLATNNLTIYNNATIAGTLRARRIIADQIEGLNIQTATLSANYITNNYYNATESAFPTLPVGNPNASGSGNLNNLFAENNHINIASYSSQFAYVDNLSATNATFSQGLMVFGSTTLSDTSIVGQLAISGNLILADKSINVLGGDLSLQPLRQGGLSIMAGLIYIDTNGNVKFGSDATFEKNVTIKGRLAANTISPIGSDLTINLASGSASKIAVNGASGSGVLTIDNFGNLIASGAASISKLNINNIVSPALASGNDINATGSAGTVTLKANKSEVTVNNKLVTESSLIYITPVGSTLGQNLYLVRQVPDASFTVGISVPVPVDTKFNFLIIN